MPKLIYKNSNQIITKEDGKTLELIIELDSWSPINEDNGLKYREKIALDAFDHQLPFNKQKINSYLDHKISIENLLASTKDQSMTIEKVDKTIVAKIKVNNENEQLTKVAKLVEKGVLESNSFIFEALEVETQPNSSVDCDIDIIFKKGNLISIDPVHAGFYPQNKARVYAKNNKSIIKILKLGEKMENKNKVKQSENIKEVLESQPVVDKEEQLATLTKISEQNLTLIKQNQDNNNRFLEISKSLVESNKTQQEAIEKVLETIKKDQNSMNKLAHSSLYSKPDSQNISTFELIKKAKIGKLSDDEKQDLFKRTYLDLPEDKKRSIEFVSTEIKDIKQSYEQRALDGTTPLKGLAVIETIQMPHIISQLEKIFPEFSDVSQKIPLSALNEVKQLIYIDDTQDVPVIGEAEDAIEFGGKTLSVLLKPHRRALHLKINKALPHYEELWDKQITNAQNQIITSLRKDFYKNIFASVDSKIDVDNNYVGGPTISARINSKYQGRLSFEDFDQIIDSFKDQYRFDNFADFVFVLHTTTWNGLIRPYITNTYSNFIPEVLDIVNKTYRGVKVITTDFYPKTKFEDKTAMKRIASEVRGMFTDNKNPATKESDLTSDEIIVFNSHYAIKGERALLFFNSKHLVAYGLDFVLEDDPYGGIKKGLDSKILTTRGEIKLTDPYINTRYVEIR
ncbi:Uncharacterised protein [Mesomycoplasma conjunctivae]|nr:hypothetical protein [Mesomycoplasma conjunctivae]VEU66407.1 Uncharacterised protein [Mesomycoplasma conjunctivae]